MVGAAAGRQSVYGVLQCCHRGDQLGVLHGCAGKTDDADAAAGANLSRRLAPGGLGDDIDKRLGTSFHAGQRLAGHATGSVQHQSDVGGIGDDIRRGGKRQSDLQGPITVDALHIDHLIGIGNTHCCITPFWGLPHHSLCDRGRP